MNTMTDQFEQNLREAFSYRDAQLDTNAIARLRAHDYRSRQHRVRRLPAFGALGATGLAAAAGVIVALGSSAAPAFAGWHAKPTTPAAGQLNQAAQTCGQGLGSPALTDSRGPYTASIYAQSDMSDLCLTGNGISMDSSWTSRQPPSLAPDGVQYGGGGMRDSAGNALTVSYGRTGDAVTGVTIELSDGSSVQATVSNGWFLAWWPGSVSAKQAEITTATGTNTVTYPATPTLTCPTQAPCSVGYGYGGGGKGAGNSSMTTRGSANTSMGGGSSASSSTAGTSSSSVASK
jgi:hypothetical protein